jgi:hypothetical protein
MCTSVASMCVPLSGSATSYSVPESTPCWPSPAFIVLVPAVSIVVGWSIDDGKLIGTDMVVRVIYGWSAFVTDLLHRNRAGRARHQRVWRGASRPKPPQVSVYNMC